MARKLTSMENDQYTLWNWSKARKLKIMENEKNALYGVKYGEKH
jgi:hypothetical protein